MIALMFHDDDCGVLLDQEGRCPTCGFHPDMQSTGFKDVSPEDVRDLLAAGHTLLGLHRVRLARKAVTGSTGSD